MSWFPRHIRGTGLSAFYAHRTDPRILGTWPFVCCAYRKHPGRILGIGISACRAGKMRFHRIRDTGLFVSYAYNMHTRRIFCTRLSVFRGDICAFSS
jgi:hypothetical protein